MRFGWESRWQSSPRMSPSHRQRETYVRADTFVQKGRRLRFRVPQERSTPSLGPGTSRNASRASPATSVPTRPLYIRRNCVRKGFSVPQGGYNQSTCVPRATTADSDRLIQHRVTRERSPTRLAWLHARNAPKASSARELPLSQKSALQGTFVHWERRRRRNSHVHEERTRTQPDCLKQRIANCARQNSFAHSCGKWNHPVSVTQGITALVVPRHRILPLIRLRGRPGRCN